MDPTPDSRFACANSAFGGNNQVMGDNDSDFLKRYAETNDQEAFAVLVRRHVDLAHSAALRQVGGDIHLARDVVQETFREVAIQAKTLTRFPSLAGWIYTVTRNKARMALRSQRRWKKRELEANAMRDLIQDADAPDWPDLRLVLDEVMHELGSSEREVLLLRYFQGNTPAEIGRRLGVGENAARMRVERSLERLRLRLARRGITSTAAALGVVLAGQTVRAAPADVVTLASRLAATTPATSAASSNLPKLVKLATGQQLNTAAALALLGAAGLLLFEKRAEAAIQIRTRQESRELALMRGDLRLLQREAARLAATTGMPEAPDPTMAALQRLSHLEALIDRGILLGKDRLAKGPTISKGLLMFFSGIFKEDGIPQGHLIPGTAAVFGLTDTETAAMQQAYTTAKNGIDAIAWEEGMLDRGIQRYAFSPLKPTPAMEEAHQRMRERFMEILGTERYHYYVLFGCEAYEEELLYGIGEHLGVVSFPPSSP
jgi:RNA polymerase sigma factor (sigma-70 family)